MNLSLTLEEKEENPEREKRKENNQIGNKKILDSCIRYLNEILHLISTLLSPRPFQQQ